MSDRLKLGMEHSFPQFKKYHNWQFKSEYAYIRADFSASYRINKKKVSHLFIMDIQNVLNRENTVGMHHNFSKRVIEPQKWSGIIPTINYRIEF